MDPESIITKLACIGFGAMCLNPSRRKDPLWEGIALRGTQLATSHGKVSKKSLVPLGTSIEN